MGQLLNRERNTSTHSMNTHEGARSKFTQMSLVAGSDVSAWHHECEWTPEEDAEASFHLKHKNCQKNPGHKNFIPIGQFNTEHLPLHWRNEEIVEWTKLIADLTVKVRVKYTSVDRPETCPDTEWGRNVQGYSDKVGKPYPFSKYRGENFPTRTGTGWVCAVHRFKGHCKCSVQCPHKGGGKVLLLTARHVIYDDSEAEHAQLIFHYDSEEQRRTAREEQARKVVICSKEMDVCHISFFSHDVEFLDSLQATVRQSDYLKRKFYLKYIEPHFNGTGKSGKTSMPNFPVIVVSHPHGCSKVVTIGQLAEDQRRQKDMKYVISTYTADTCPGSSGAQICGVDWRSIDAVFSSPVHSAGLEDGLNGSAAWLRLK